MYHVQLQCCEVVTFCDLADRTCINYCCSVVLLLHTVVHLIRFVSCSVVVSCSCCDRAVVHTFF